MRAVARGGDVGGDRVAESLLVIFGGDLVVKRPSCTDSIEDKSVQELVIFVWYRACPKVQSWNNRSSEPPTLCQIAEVNRTLIPILY